MKRTALRIGIVAAGLVAGIAFADEAVMKELAPTGKLRVGIAVGPNPGAGNVAIDAATGKPRGVAADLGAELAQKLRVPVEFVSFPNSGALTDAAGGGTWDVAFIPVDEERKKKVDFGPAHIILQSTFLVPAGSTVARLADVDKPGMRVVGVENTATGRAAQRSLKNVTMTYVKTAQELFELLQSGKADAIAQSRESLTGLSTRLPGSRVLDGGFLNSFVAIAVPKNKAAALAYVSTFLEEAKASGSVRRAIESSGLPATIAAPAGARP